MMAWAVVCVTKNLGSSYLATDEKKKNSFGLSQVVLRLGEVKSQIP